MHMRTPSDDRGVRLIYTLHRITVVRMGMQDRVDEVVRVNMEEEL